MFRKVTFCPLVWILLILISVSTSAKASEYSLCWSPTATPTPIVSPTATPNNTGQLAHLLSQLKDVPGDDGDPVPDKCVSGLLAVKKAVKAMIVKDMLKYDPSVLGVEKVQEMIFSEIKDSMGGYGSKQEDENGYAYLPFGCIQGLTVKTIPSQEDLLAVEVDMAVGCGEDISLYFFRKTKDGWKAEINYESVDYKNGGAREDLMYVVSPPDATGDYFIAAISGSSHCQSCWGGMEVDVLRKGLEVDKPEVIFTDSEFYYRCDSHHLRLRENGFQIDFDGRQGLDVDHDAEAKNDSELGGGIFNRPVIRTYQVEKDKVTLIAPIANYPEDFVDEWLNQPWDFSKNLCQPQNAEKLEKWHETLNEKDVWNPSILFVQSCPGKPERWEIGIKTRGKKLPEAIYFEVVRDGDFILEDIIETRKDDCPGNTPAQSHALGEE